MTSGGGVSDSSICVQGSGHLIRLAGKEGCAVGKKKKDKKKKGKKGKKK